ncbi:hypothetical protein BV25DRAFT_821216 [Artomyces pyxidatus]|uniref:Uncharacterized protein n=1 Tax=Artomyces pyxidatus TaxID=48021 RepID=A0ACB8SXS4_9AGAM|nr:hypothetical protein BV25DRAFT_821216 [Artomyces pyxidatus]
MNLQNALFNGPLLRSGYLAFTFTPEAAYFYAFRLLQIDPDSVATYTPNSPTATPMTYFYARPLPTHLGQQPRQIMLDIRVSPSFGSVVPQRLWTPHSRSMADAFLEPPIWFVDVNGMLGLSLVNAAAGFCHNLNGATNRMQFGGKHSTQIRINWPGYQEWNRQIRVRDETPEQNPISLERFARHVGRSVDIFLEQCSSDLENPDARWRIGVNGITREAIVIIGAVHISPGSWQPIVQLYHHLHIPSM